MAHLIDKDALVAEIEKRKGTIGTNSFLSEYEAGCNDGREDAYGEILSFLDTLEVKEVNLDAEINLWVKNLHSVPNFEELNKFAKHFFGLGIKAKGE